MVIHLVCTFFFTVYLHRPQVESNADIDLPTKKTRNLFFAVFVYYLIDPFHTIITFSNERLFENLFLIPFRRL